MDALPPLNIDKGDSVTPTIKRLTSGAIDGTGVFDQMMTTMNKHLEAQLKKGNIEKTDYAQVYLGVAQQTLSQAIQFMLNELQVQKYEAEITLTRQKLGTEIAQTADEIPSGICLVDGLVEGLLGAQKDKIKQEKELLAQRELSEMAQTQDNINEIPVGGVLGKQIYLYGNQGDGYLRDAEQKATKIFTDVWGIGASLDVRDANATNNLQDSDLGLVVTKLMAGINVTA